MTAAIGLEDASGDRRRRIRYLAAGLSAATAFIYVLIGLGIVSVVDEVAGDAPDLLTFGLAAGAAYVLGAALLVAFDRRALWFVGSVLQVGVIVMYLVVSSTRTPPFEVWGVAIKVLQLVLLGALLYLSVRPPAGPTSRVEPRPLDLGGGGMG